MDKMTLLEYAKAANPEASAIWLTNGELVNILTQLADLRDAIEVMRGEAEPHPIEEAVEIEQVIDAVLNTAENVEVVSNPVLNGGVRYPENLGTRSIISGGEVMELDVERDDHWYHDNPNY